jgi:hypothetical protein
MKKTFPFFIAIIAVALLSGCAKERDNYDKFLTTGTWTLSSATQEQKSVTNYNYIALATPDRTETSENNNTIADGKSTQVQFSQTALLPGTTTFSRQTQIGNLSWTMKFNKDGTYELTRTYQRLSSQTDTHIGNGPVTKHNRIGRNLNRNRDVVLAKQHGYKTNLTNRKFWRCIECRYFKKQSCAFFKTSINWHKQRFGRFGSVR